MGRKARGGLSRGELKLKRAREAVFDLRTRTRRAETSYEALISKVVCTHPVKEQMAVIAGQLCRLCGHIVHRENKAP